MDARDTQNNWHDRPSLLATHTGGVSAPSLPMVFGIHGTLAIAHDLGRFRQRRHHADRHRARGVSSVAATIATAAVAVVTVATSVAVAITSEPGGRTRIGTRPSPLGSPCPRCPRTVATFSRPPYPRSCQPQKSRTNIVNTVENLTHKIFKNSGKNVQNMFICRFWDVF